MRDGDATPPETVAMRAPDLPRPINLHTVFLGGLFLLATLAACYFAAEIVLPFVLAFVLNAVFRPVLRALERIGVPRTLAALLIVLALVAVFAVIGLLVAVPLSEIIGRLPQLVGRLQARLSFLIAPFHALQKALAHLQLFGRDTNTPAVAVETSELPQQLLRQARTLAGGGFTTGLVLFFVLVAGDEFLRRLVEILPDFRTKRKLVDISREIEQDISTYLATITMMNTLVGFAVAGMAALCGLPDPLLWGTVAFLLNYVPILGPTAGVILFLAAGLLSDGPLWAAFLPAGLYLLIHVLEGETVTPLLLASRFTVNPVLVVLGVVFWYWMWGVCGAILSTPMLAMTKIVCDRVDYLKPFGHFMAGGSIFGIGGDGSEAGSDGGSGRC